MSSYDEWKKHAPKLNGVHLFIAFPLSIHTWMVRFHDMLTSLGCRVSVRHYRAGHVESDLKNVRELYDGVTEWLLIRSTTHKVGEAEIRKIVITTLDDSSSRKSAEAVVMRSECRTSRPMWAEIINLIRSAELGGVKGQFARLAELVDGQIRELLPEEEGADINGDRTPIKAAESWVVLEHIERIHELAVWSTPYVACEIAERLTKFGLYYKALCYLEDFDQHAMRASESLLVRVQQLRGLVYRRTDELDRAHDVFQELVDFGWNDPETLGILGANWMKRYERSEAIAGQIRPEGERNKPSGNQKYLESSLDCYTKALELVPDDTYVGINVAAKSLFLGDKESAQQHARCVLDILKHIPEHEKDYWKKASEAEAFLLLEQYEQAAERYRIAVNEATYDLGSHQSTWAQAKRILQFLDRGDEHGKRFQDVFKSSWPRLDASREVRMAVVMYGGVSLAIYINGVAQELLNLVRSTAPLKTHPELALPDESLSTTDRVYRKLARKVASLQSADASNKEGADAQGKDGAIGVRFVIDILSGTSAGGINAIFLAKALANSENLKLIKQLWIEDADMNKLVNDSGLGAQCPKSLLDSRYMLDRLIHAFKSTAGDPEAEALACASELDLFVTATDLNGLKVAVPLANQVVEEKRFRNVFRFRFNQPMSINDFAAEDIPFLAFSARCTSAFPFAFEPMQLDRLPTTKELKRDFPTVDSRHWRRFYRDYLDVDHGTDDEEDRFPQRQFGDGGYLDNKPFSYAIEALSNRQTGTPVDRKLIYIEPAPKLETKDSLIEFDVVQNSLSALISLPRYETIREDLEQVNRRNERIRQVNDTLRNLQDDVVKWWDKTARENESDDSAKKKRRWLDMGVDELIQRRGISYGAYHRLKVAHLRDEIALMISAAAGFRQQSAQEVGVRRVVREWTNRRYRENSQTSVTDDRPLQNRFLFDLDLSYRIRRLRFVVGKCDQIIRDPDSYKDLLQQTDLPAIPSDQFNAAVCKAVRAARRKLNPVLSELDLLRQRLKERQTKDWEWNAMLENPLQGIIANSMDRETSQTLSSIAMAREGAELRDQLDGFLKTHGRSMDTIADGLKQRLSRPLVQAAAYCSRALLLNDYDVGDVSPVERAVLSLLGDYYRCYEDYDQVTFPNLFQTELGEGSEVDVVRFSPADAGLFEENEKSSDEKRSEQKTLSREQVAEAQLKKLAGTSYYAFAGFLKESWRGNDILWGRLHAAERIISMLLPEKPEDCKELLEKARDIIISEEAEFISKEEVTRKLREAEQSSSGGKTTRKAIDRIAKILGQGHHSILPTDKGELRRYVLNDFEVDRNLESKLTLRLVGRSTQVVGRILDGLSDTYRGTNKLGLWVSRVGKWFTGMVEVAIPGSISQLVFRRWLWLFYLFGLTLWLMSSTVLQNKAVSAFSLQLLVFTVAVHIGWLLLKDFINTRVWPRWPGHPIWVVKLLFVAFLTGLTLMGGYVFWEYYVGPRIGDPHLFLNRLRLLGLGGGLLAASGIVSHALLSLSDEKKKNVPRILGAVVLTAGLSLLAVVLCAATEVFWSGEEWSYLDPRVFLHDWWVTPPFTAD